MRSNLHYVVCLRTSNQDFYLLWKDGGNEPDRYVTLPESSRFLHAKTRAGLVRLAKANDIEVSSEPAHLVDIAKMENTLGRLRPDRPLSQRSAQVLMASWNALEDMCGSIGVPIHPVAGSKAEVQHVYDKLFYGNNLPSVTPEESVYQPALSSRELAVLRSALRNSWQEVARTSWPSELSR